MSGDERSMIPVGPDTFSSEEFASATDRVRVARVSALENPEFAALVDGKLERMGQRVETLKALRKARGLTQAQLTEELGMTQGEVSRLERRDNLHLATLSRFIEATGGRLRITAIYDNTEVEVAIGDLAKVDPPVEA